MSGRMFASRIADLSLDAAAGRLRYSRHYRQRLPARPTPNQSEIRFMLCNDDPQVIEDYPEDSRGSSCLIRGETDIDGRVGHLLCSNPPDSLIITAYFPGETEPEEWDTDYWTRSGRGDQP